MPETYKLVEQKCFIFTNPRLFFFLPAHSRLSSMPRNGFCELTDPSSHRDVILPIKYHDIWDLLKKHRRGFWDSDEVALHHDMLVWRNTGRAPELVKPLDAAERCYIKNVISFFLFGDQLVNVNIAENFMGVVTIPEARTFYNFQVAMEDIHAEMYAQIAQVYYDGDKERDDVFDAVQAMPAVQASIGWAQRWADDKACTLDERIIAFICVEGVLFSTKFAAVFWLKKRTNSGVPGLAQANELISREEGLHVQFGVLMHKYCGNKVGPERITEIVRSAVECEKAFVDATVPETMMFASRADMRGYAEYVGDYTLGLLGLPPTYGTPNPLRFMDAISLFGKTNFFERRVSEYKRASSSSSAPVVGNGPALGNASPLSLSSPASSHASLDVFSDQHPLKFDAVF